MITATFRAKCPACGDTVHRGDEIERTEIGWTHLACADVEYHEPTPAAVCEACWLTIPCDCDDCDCRTHAAIGDAS